MSKYKMPVTWEMCGYVDVEADSIEEAVKTFNETSDDISLPNDGEYVDGSFRLSADSVEDIEAMLAPID